MAEASTQKPEGYDVASEGWTFDRVQERLVEAMILLWRLPDRERGWLRTATMSLWRQVSPTAGLNALERAEYLLADVRDPPRVPPATRRQIDEMEEALGWMRVVADRDRRLVGLAITQLARGDNRVSWRKVMTQMGLKRGSDGLRMRYGRALRSIAASLDAPGNCAFLDVNDD